MPTYTLDRKRFIEYYATTIFKLIQASIITEDLIKGSEYILTAEDVLEKVGMISGHFWGLTTDIHHSKITLIYS